MKTDIQIAQETEALRISEIAKAAGIDEKYVEPYGYYKAKIDYNIMADKKDTPDGKVVLSTVVASKVAAFLDGK